MNTPTPGSLAFLSWVRAGLAGQLLRGGATAAAGGRLQLPIEVRISAGPDAAHLADRAPIEMPIAFLGPVDVAGIDPSHVIRTTPAELTANFEPNLFASIEFDRPDLPWMFSPTAPDPDATLRWQPWITLIVVPVAIAQVVAAAKAEEALPSIACPRSELPPLAQAWAWAHVQVAQNTKPEAVEVLLSDPARSLSRLICARRLMAHRQYVACVVPTYELGRRAGLGMAISSNDLKTLALEPAWSATTSAGVNDLVTLPVYFHWQFSTSDAADFQSLAEKLKLAPTPAGLGLTTVDTAQPGWGMPTVPDDDPTARRVMSGALRARGPGPSDWPAAETTRFESRLRDVLNKPAELSTLAGPLIGPPLYGQAYPRASQVPGPDGSPRWLRDLNLKPENRIAAGLGALVVRYEQEALMAAAWTQLADHERENRDRKRRQVGEAVQSALEVRRSVSATARPAAFEGPTLRRLTRPGTAASRMHASPVSAATSTASRALMTDSRFHVESPAMLRLAAEDESAATAPPTDLQDFTPEFGTAMGDLLADYFPGFLLWNTDRIGTNSILLLQSDPVFVEAFMVGLNHEMGRELLWRRFPVASNGTYFRTFWNRGARAGLGTADAEVDILPVAEWKPASALGENGPHALAADGDAPAVILIRGELLQHYPNAMIYALRATWSGPDRVIGVEEMLPLFHVTRAPDVTLIGFELSPNQLRGADTNAGDAGWFFVLQELPSEPRFGLNGAAEIYGKPPLSWRDLAWSDVAVSAEALEAMSYLSLDAEAVNLTLPLSRPAQGASDPPQATWAASAADMALITRQLPVRLAVHARSWL